MVVANTPSTGDGNGPWAEGPLPAEVGGGQSGERIQVTESRAPLVPYLHSGLKSAVPPQPPIAPLMRGDCHQA